MKPFALSARRRRPPRLRLESLVERINPVVVNGTAGNDVITTRLMPEGSSTPDSVDILVNGSVATTIGLNGFWPFPTVSWFLSEDLTINGLGGNDQISAGLIRPPAGGVLHFNGGDGNDTIVGSFGHDEIDGEAGADDMDAGVDEDTIFADPADTRIVGGGGVDLMSMSGIHGAAIVTLTSLTVGGHTLSTAAGTFTNIMMVNLYGSDTNDVLNVSGMFRVQLYGNGGNDLLTTDASESSFQEGGAGNDTMNGGGGSDMMDGGAGNDVMFGGLDNFPAFTHNFLSGGPGNDVITGGPGSNDLGGGPGNDRVTGGPLGDNLWGQEGNDSLSGGDGNDVLYGDDDGVAIVYPDALDGGAGDDQLNGDRLDSRLIGGPGSDGMTLTRLSGTVTLTDTALTINGRPVTYSSIENAVLVGSNTADTLDGSRYSGFLSLLGGAGNDTLRAGSQGAQLSGDAGSDALFGGPGDDSLTADPADARLSGDGGSNSLSVDAIDGTAVLTDTSLTINGRRIPTTRIAFAALVGLDDADTLDASAFSGMAFLTGLGGNDVLRGSAGGGQLDGGEGADDLQGGAGDEYLYGDATDTRLVGGGGVNSLNFIGTVGGNVTITDRLLTINGRDVPFGGFNEVNLVGSDDNDVLDASAFSGRLIAQMNGGDDQVVAGAGDSYLDGGAGNDTLTGGAGDDLIFGGSGENLLDGGAGNDRLFGGNDNDFIIGGEGDDTVDAALGDDVINGGVGNDSLNGGWGNDFVSGWEGDDFLDGSLGLDTLLGAAGADQFVKDTDPIIYALEQTFNDFNAGEGDTEI